MDGNLIGIQTEFETIECCNCHCIFAVSSPLYHQFRETGEFFYCPRGHKQHYTKTKIQRMQEEIDRQKRILEYRANEISDLRKQRAHKERQVIGYKGALAKTKKRIANGACPCCKRSFQNLKRHMETKHPNYRRETS